MEKLTKLINEVIDNDRGAREAEYSGGKIWYYLGNDTLKSYSEVYKLMNKCKVYAMSKGYSVSSFLTSPNNWNAVAVDKDKVDYTTSTDHKTEFDAVFEAIGWVIEQELK